MVLFPVLVERSNVGDSVVCGSLPVSGGLCRMRGQEGEFAGGGGSCRGAQPASTGVAEDDESSVTCRRVGKCAGL